MDKASRLRGMDVVDKTPKRALRASNVGHVRSGKARKESNPPAEARHRGSEWFLFPPLSLDSLHLE